MSQDKGRLSTNLVGRKVHLLTDAEAREEALRQAKRTGREIDLTMITAENWLPGLGMSEYRVLKGVIGEIVAVHLDKDSCLVYKILFRNQVLSSPSADLFRFEV